jgi:Methyltransferase domain
MKPQDAVEVAYQVVLRRRPDPGGRDVSLEWLRSRNWTNRDLVDSLRASSEFHRSVRFPGKLLGHSLHASRCEFVRSLPPAQTIVDLGGTDLGNPEGALVAMGYPYRFDRLTIIDLPSEDRHAIYRQESRPDRVETQLGPVYYRYHSMTDLSDFADASVDLVYSGQSIEHVTPADAKQVLEEVARILRPGGHVAIDTPNAEVTRLQQAEFVDPDHKVEYRLEDLRELVEGTGLQVVDCKGANYAGRSVAAGRFDLDEAAGNAGLYWAADACYLLCLVAGKPA